jgi:hypothetical protein
MYSYTVERYTATGSRGVVGVLTSETTLSEEQAAHRGSAWVVEGMAVIVSDDSCQSGWGSPKNGRAPAVVIYNTDDREDFVHLDDGGPVRI